MNAILAKICSDVTDYDFLSRIVGKYERQFQWNVSIDKKKIINFCLYRIWFTETKIYDCIKWRKLVTDYFNSTIDYFLSKNNNFPPSIFRQSAYYWKFSHIKLKLKY